MRGLRALGICGAVPAVSMIGLRSAGEGGPGHVNDADVVVGLTGQKGLMEYIADLFPQEVHVQRVGTKPFPATREGA